MYRCGGVWPLARDVPIIIYQNRAEQSSNKWNGPQCSFPYYGVDTLQRLEAGGLYPHLQSLEELFELEVEVGSRAVNKPSRSLTVPGCLSAKIITDGTFG